MADIGILNKQDKKTSTSAPKAGLDTVVDNVKDQLSDLKNIMYVVILVLLVGFMAAIYSYFQMTKDSFTDYKNTLDKINDNRIKMLENRVQQLENSATNLVK